MKIRYKKKCMTSFGITPEGKGRTYKKMTVTPVSLSYEAPFLATSVVEDSAIQVAGQQTVTVDFSSPEIKIDGFDTEWGME